MNPALSTEIHDLADDLYGADQHLDELVDNLLAIHHTDHDNVQLSALVSRLAGESGVIRLLALVLEAKADSKAVQTLDATDRHAAKSHLHQLTADLDHITHQAHADQAAGHLDPA